jgi:hypothetical protein
VQLGVLGQPAQVRRDRRRDHLVRGALGVPQRRQLGGHQFGRAPGDRPLEVGRVVEVPVQAGAGHAGALGDLLGRDVRAVLGDRLEGRVDELRAPPLLLARPARRPSVDLGHGGSLLRTRWAVYAPEVSSTSRTPYFRRRP